MLGKINLPVETVITIEGNVNRFVQEDSEEVNNHLLNCFNLASIVFPDVTIERVNMDGEEVRRNKDNGKWVEVGELNDIEGDPNHYDNFYAF